MRFAPASVANILLVAAAIGFGSLLRPLIPKPFSLLDRVAMVLLGGIGLLGTILFCVGQFWFSRAAIVSVLLLGVLLCVRPLRGVIREFRTTLVKVPWPILPVTIVAAVLVVTIIGGFALPIFSTSYDAVMYHYLGPKVWVKQGLIRGVPDEVLTYFPAVVESQYAALLSIGRDRALGLFSVTSLCSLLLITSSLAVRLGLSSTRAWWAVALVATTPAVYKGTYYGFIDALFAGFVLAAIRLAFDAERGRDFALFGIFCGFAMGTKYTGIDAWAILAACSFVTLIWGRRLEGQPRLKWLMGSCVIAIAVASPFYGRNWLLFGCPIYPPPPVLLNFFSVKKISPEILEALVQNMQRTGRGMGGGIMNLVLLPFHLTYHTANFLGGTGGIGLAPLALGPFAAIARRRDLFTKGVLLFAGLQMGAWFLTAQVSRYLIHVYVLGVIFGVIGWVYVSCVGGRSGRLLAEAVIAVSVLYGLWMIGADRKEDLHATLSASYEAKRWEAETPNAASIQYVNHEPLVKSVLILDKNFPAYYLEKPYIKAFGRWGERPVGAANIAEVLSKLPQLHTTHVLDVGGSDASFVLSSHRPGLTLVFEHADQKIYRVDDEEASSQEN
jgi:Dolichyl-phosphate-mannose-protein mannosyltransferase